ncbi:PREDICTED: caveolin-3-like [Branchiostoma belcheri]|uniref:Caveolin n=1 Tax=Branchiostoma belcheri TaxID=7741 RepID=A0A6P5A8Z7_BRABE|nr:PREDICTED: caveolin-3-like [Branchiostoma belcheri]
MAGPLLSSSSTSVMAREIPSEFGLDMDMRDPNNINEHTKVLFEDVFAEPEGTHSADGVWRWSFKCYNGSKSCCYKTLTYICALPVACCWGCEFACLSFCQIWAMIPCIKTCNITLASVKQIWGSLVHTCLDPCNESCALCLSNIKITQQTA